jgi:hypothetical protein
MFFCQAVTGNNHLELHPGPFSEQSDSLCLNEMGLECRIEMDHGDHGNEVTIHPQAKQGQFEGMAKWESNVE